MLTSASLCMIVTNAVFMAASFVSVLLRLLARRHQMLLLEADDWLCMAAWVFSALLSTTNILGVPIGGFGIPFDSLSDGEAENFLKILFILQFWYIIAVALVKLSVLCFYGRVFKFGSRPIIIRIFMGLVIAWLVAFLFATLFQILPIECNWINCPETSNYALMYTLCSATDIFLDICILAIPAFFIGPLRVSRNQKIGLFGVFGLGLFCVIASCARLVYTVDFLEVNNYGGFAVSFDTAVVNIIMWSGIEANASIICANLPTYRPLMLKLRDSGFFSSSVRYMRSSRSHPSGADSIQSQETMINTTDGSHRYAISGGRTSAAGMLEKKPPRAIAEEVRDGIRMTWDIEQAVELVEARQRLEQQEEPRYGNRNPRAP